MKSEFSVLHIVSNLGIGGAQAVIANTCNEMLLSTHWNSLVLPLSDDSALLSRFNEGTVILEPVMHRHRYYVRTIYRICIILRDIRPDVLHLHLWLPKLIGTFCGLLCGVPVIVTTEHSGYPWTKSTRKLMDRFLSQYVDKRIMVCKYIENLFLQERICDAGKSTVMYNPIPQPEAINSSAQNAAREELSISTDTIVFLFVGALRTVKNLARLLNSFASYLNLSNSPSSILLIVGDGPKLADLKKLSSEKCISDRVDFQLSCTSLSKYYAAADIFIMTSEVEGFSIALADAMHHGIVPICTDSGGTPELITDGETGFLLDSKSSTKDASVFLMVAESAKLRAKVGGNAMKFVRTITDPGEYVSKLIELYSNSHR